MNLSIVIAVTESYCHALKALVRALAQNVFLPEIAAGHFIFASDGSKPVHEAAALAKESFPPGWEFHVLELRVKDNAKDYAQQAQLTIAQLRTAGFAKARALGCEQAWSLDSDVLPPPNALRCMQDILRFDGGYYEVATCPYVSQGGGGWLFGRGTPHNHIAPDMTEEERIIPEELKERLRVHRAAMTNAPEWFEVMKKLEEEVKQCAPAGNVFELNGKFGWKPRGWGDWAYPAIGKGAIVPSDWCGFGCTLLGKRALALADFAGYEGRGTEDLFCVWRKWFPSGVKIAAIPHVLCSHVIRKKDRSGFVLVEGYHESEGIAAGHLRTRYLPWYSQEPGELFDPKNDGKH